MPPANPAFSLLYCPHPPAPLPLRGRGRLKVNFAGGFAPGTPALNRSRHLQFLPYRCPAGARPPPPGTQTAGIAGAARVQPRGCKGRSPLHKITLILPLPAGKGGGGMGERKQTKGRVGRRPKPPSPPCGVRKGRVGWRQRRQAPLRTPQRQGRQATAPLRPRRYKMFTKVRASPP